MVRLYSYVVRYDIGFAPNPFYGWCTLATCKQDIRRKAAGGDWIVGTGSKGHGAEGRLVYAMRVDEILTFDAYWDDPRFARKRPDRHGNVKRAYGDNIYHRDSSGQWIQEDSRHSLSDGSSNQGHIDKDTGTNAVLASRHYTYWGACGPDIPQRLRDGELDLVHAVQSHRCRFPDDMRDEAIAWLESLESGVHADPPDWSHSR